MRFRWEMPLFLGAIMLAAWLINGIEPAFQFRDLMRYLRVGQQERYVMIAVLGVVACVVCLLARMLGYGRREE